VCGSGAVVCSWSLLVRGAQRARYQAETPLIALCRFPGPALLSQIEQLTPQSLTILADNLHWPTMKLPGYSVEDGKITSDWLAPFAGSYSRSKGIGEKELVNRVQHSIKDLINRGFIEAYLIGELAQSHDARCVLTDMGTSLIPYLNPPKP
jgi:hypothetical protein